MTAFSNVVANAEVITGLSASELRRMSPNEFRRYLEKRNHKKISFYSEFPTMGRVNILRDDIKETSDINKEIDAILG